MQEDKTSKWLAAELRKQQEENPLPYESGAWEAFEEKRTVRSGKKLGLFWLSGIAASLVILFVAGGFWLFDETELAGSNSLSGQIPMEEKAETSESKLEEQSVEVEEQNRQIETQDLGSSEKIDSENRTSIPALDSPKSINQMPIQIKISTDVEVKMTENLAELDRNAKQESLAKSDRILPEITSQEKFGNETGPTKAEVPEKVVAEVALPKEPQLTEEEIKEILDTKSFASIVMGLSPGFGASQGTKQSTSGTSMGLGVMVDMELTGKLVMGSGVALNYLNQASESQSYAQVAGFASPITEKNEIAQVQVDIPLYFKYPITRNQSISVQAGFSNLVTFNQYAEQQSSYTRQVAVVDTNSASSNFFTLKSESVAQSSVLEVPQNRFYPFATANLGVNIRLFETKKTSYEVMPFYNYPLQEFSGYGEKLGMFGASFKVNFGGAQKK